MHPESNPPFLVWLYLEILRLLSKLNSRN